MQINSASLLGCGCLMVTWEFGSDVYENKCSHTQWQLKLSIVLPRNEFVKFIFRWMSSWIARDIPRESYSENCLDLFVNPSKSVTQENADNFVAPKKDPRWETWWCSRNLGEGEKEFPLCGYISWPLGDMLVMRLQAWDTITWRPHYLLSYLIETSVYPHR